MHDCDFLKNITMYFFAYFCLFLLSIVILEATKTDARDRFQFSRPPPPKRPTFPGPKSKAGEMCKRYITQNCKPSDRIVGGVLAKPKEFPHMARVGVRDRKTVKWICGGSLISENFILTAAHCVISDHGTPDTIRLGDLNSASKQDDAMEDDYRITNFIIHPDYNFKTNENDIALLQFRGVFSFNEYIRPICLNTLSDDQELKFVAIGWGNTAHMRNPSNDLLKVELYSQNPRKCKSNPLYIGFDSNIMLCVGYRRGGSDTCQGDSGGPLLIKNENPYCSIHRQFGITSYGDVCGAVDTPGVYTRISSFIPWIESIVWNGDFNGKES